MKRGKYRSIFLTALCATAIATCWLRGPFFGLVFVIFAAPWVVLAALVLWYARLPRRAWLVLAAISGAVISYVVSAPPSTSHLFRDYLHTSVGDNLRDLRRWNDNWARDPAYYFKFHASEATIAALVNAGRLVDSEHAGLASPPPHFLLRVPDWWKPEETTEPRTWQNRAGAGIAVELCYDPDSGVAYLVFAMF